MFFGSLSCVVGAESQDPRMGKVSSLAATDSNLIPQLGLQIYIPHDVYTPHPERGRKLPTTWAWAWAATETQTGFQKVSLKQTLWLKFLVTTSET